MLLSFLYLLTTSSLWAADTLQVVPPHPVNEPSRWTEFDRTSGLAGRVRSIYEDRDGNIWFATDRGAQRYDGRTWTTYTTEDGLASNSVAGVYQTRDGAYWFTLRAGGISRFDSSKGSGKAAWTLYRVGRPAGVSIAGERRLETAEDSLLAGVFWGGNHLQETRDGTLWAGTVSPAGGQGGIMRFDPSTALSPSQSFGGQGRTGGTAWALVPGPAGQPLPSVTDIHETRDGMLWFAAGDDGVLRLDPSSGAWTRYTQTDGLGEAAFVLLEDNSGTLWVYGRGTQHRFDPRVQPGAGSSTSSGHNGGRWYPYSSDVRERFGRGSRVFNGVPWAGTPDGELCYFDGASWQCATDEETRNPAVAITRSALWFYRGDGAKADRFDTGPGRWTGYQGVRTLHSIHSDDALFAIGDDIWLTSPDGVVRYDGTHFIQYSAEDGLIDGQVTTVLEGRDGSIWVAGRHKGGSGAARFDCGGWQIFSTDDGLVGENIYVGLVADNGDIWFGTKYGARNVDGRVGRGAGVIRYDGRRWQVYTDEDGLVSNQVYTLAETPDGAIWVGTIEGLSRFDPETDTWTTHSPGVVDSQRPEKFRALWVDRQGILWTGFDHNRRGAARFDGTDWTWITTDDGLIADDVWEIRETRDGVLWFLTGSGISRLQPQDGSWTSYPNDVYPVNANPGSMRTIAEASDGSLWIANQEFTRFAPDRNAPETRLEPASDQVSSAGNILLRWSGHDLWNDTPPDETRYQWRMDEGEWSEVRSLPDFTFTSLSDGQHRFEVRAIDRDGNVDPTPAVHAFLVEGPWWKNPWVAGVALVMLGLIGVQTGRVVRRDQRVREANRELTVEAALERVRAAALGMEKSEDVHGVSEVVFEEFEGLGYDLFRSSIVIVDRDAQTMEMWVSRRDYEGPPVIKRQIPERSERLPMGLKVWDAWEQGEPHFVYELAGQELVDAYKTWRDRLELGDEWYDGVMRVLPDRQVIQVVFYPRGHLHLVTNEPLPDEAMVVARRFADVFEFAYERFLELKEKEAQARQAERQAAVARVRAEAASMRRAEDLQPLVKAIMNELAAADVAFDTGSILIVDEEAGFRRVQFATREGLTGGGETPLSEVSEEWMAIWKGGEPVVRKREIALSRDTSTPGTLVDAPFAYGAFSLGVEEPGAFSQEDIDLVAGFADVISLGYARYLDFQKLEAQNEAMSEANRDLFQANVELQRDRAVERIRAEVQSMDEAEDFERVLSLLTGDLKEVGLTFSSCEIDVLDEFVEHPSMELFERDGFRYTTFTLDPDGHVAYDSFVLPAPFPAVNLQTIERFIANEPWQGMSEDQRIVEVPAGSYGRLRLTASDRDRFTDDEVATLRQFADAIALGYARYLDIREIQAGTERKSAFLASISHELRTPMNAIKGFTNLVLRREKDLSDRGQENLEKVDQASDHLLAMVNDLLDLSKIEAGRMDVVPTSFDVEQAIRSCSSTVSPLVKEGVELTVEIDSSLGEVRTDEARVRQMVINLLSNAIKFTDSGEVIVRASRAPLVTSPPLAGPLGDTDAKRNNSADSPPPTADRLVIAVSDTGKGIPEEELPTIFDEYRQVAGSGSDVQKGTGLGLSITKQFAELLGGSIGVESEVGKGTTFTVKIPAEYSA